MPSPLVSIIIPTFNRANLLPQAVQSTLAQTHPAVEVVVVNDGSADHTFDVLDSFGAKIVVVTQANRGLGSARSAGLLRARGEMIAFLDDDDALTPDSISRRLAPFAVQPELDIVYSDLFLTDETGSVQGRFFVAERRQPPSGDLYEALLPRNFIPIHAMLWRRSVLERAGNFPERSGAEDWEYLIRVAEFARFCYVDEPLGYYRLHAGNMTRQQAQQVQGYGIVQEQIPSSPRFARVPPARRARVLTRYAAQQWLEGDRALGRRFLQMARQADPANPFPILLSGLMLLGRRLARKLVHGVWQAQDKLNPALSATAYFRRER